MMDYNDRVSLYSQVMPESLAHFKASQQEVELRGNNIGEINIIQTCTSCDNYKDGKCLLGYDTPIYEECRKYFPK